MSAYYAPDTVLDTRNIVINKETKISPSSGTSILVGQETILCIILGSDQCSYKNKDRKKRDRKKEGQQKINKKERKG